MLDITSAMIAATAIAASTAAQGAAPAAAPLTWEHGELTVSTSHPLTGEDTPFGADVLSAELLVQYGPDGPYVTGPVTYLECPEQGAAACSPVAEGWAYADGAGLDLSWRKRAGGLSVRGEGRVDVGWDTVDTFTIDLTTAPVGKVSRERVKDELGTTVTLTRDQVVDGTVNGYPITEPHGTHTHVHRTVR